MPRKVRKGVYLNTNPMHWGAVSVDDIHRASLVNPVGDAPNKNPGKFLLVDLLLRF